VWPSIFSQASLCFSPGFVSAAPGSGAQYAPSCSLSWIFRAILCAFSAASMLARNLPMHPKHDIPARPRRHIGQRLGRSLAQSAGRAVCGAGEFWFSASSCSSSPIAKSFFSSRASFPNLERRQGSQTRVLARTSHSERCRCGRRRRCAMRPQSRCALSGPSTEIPSYPSFQKY
jgi:hypothetical protein